MNKAKLIIAAAAAVLAGNTAHADTVIHITGATAFRSGAIASIQTVLGGSANVKSAFLANSSGLSGANRAIIQSTGTPFGAGAGIITVKCAWSGSTGGIKTLVQNLDVTEWMSVSNLAAAVAGTPLSVAAGSISYTLDPGETPKADVTFQDSAQASTGFTTTTLTETRVGVIPFEWVAGNGSAATLTNITPLIAQAALSGGAPLSLFDGSTSATPVYVMGRNFDSGTRLSCLTESGLSPFAGIQHVQAVTTGTLGGGGGSITKLRYYRAETVLGQLFGTGQSGYSSGGTLADVLAAPGAQTAITAAGAPDIVAAAGEELLYGPGHTIAYLARADAARACKVTAPNSNTAHRLKFNGQQHWVEPITASTGVPAAYKDDLIKEGVIATWEFEYLSYRESYSGDGKTVADAIRDDVIVNLGAVDGIKLSEMHCTKAVEGGVITSTRL